MKALIEKFYIFWTYFNSARLNKNNRFTHLKRRAFTVLHGDVIEIGPGCISNIAFLPPSVSSYVGLEPNLSFGKILVSSRFDSEIDIRILAGRAEKIPILDNSVDAVICSFVLCSVSDQSVVLSEIRRVLKVGGQFLFVEHIGASPRSINRLFQNMFTPLSRYLCGGCEWNRDTMIAVSRAGFSVVQSTYPWQSLRRPLGPIIFGRAWK